MKMNEKILLMQYLIHEQARLEEEVQYTLTRLRYRTPDAVDNIEYLIARERLTAFNQFRHSIVTLLKICESEKEKET